MLRNLTQNQKYIVAAVYVCSMVLSSLDATIINVTLATLGTEFGVPASDIEAVSVGYMVSLAVIMPMSGWLTDRFGTKNVFLSALFVYAITNLFAGFSSSLNILVMWRVLQGLGGGLLVPVGMTLLYRTFPPAERIGVGRILMFATILGPALGPVVGGGILSIATWPWTFYAKVPIAGAALLYGWLYLKDERDDVEAGRLDWIGFLFGGVGLGAAMFAMLNGPDMGWTSPQVLILAIGGVGLLIAFAWHELRTPKPLVDLRLLSNRLFFSTARVSFFATAGFLGTLFLVPLFLQSVRDETPLVSGITTMWEAIGVVISTQIVARIYPKLGPSKLMGGSLLLVACAILALSSINLTTPLPFVSVCMFVLGVGMAGIFLPNQAASMATIPREKLGGASMVFSVQRQIASALGVAVLSTVLSIVGVTHIVGGIEEPNLAAWRIAFWVAAAFAIVGSMMGWRVPDEDAAETMQTS